MELRSFTYPIRSVSIALFSYIEVLYCLNTAYLYEQSGIVEIIKISRNDKNVRKFMNRYLLSDRNNYYHENRDIFSNISAIELRKLRNSLVHFYSPSSRFAVIHKSFEEKGKDLEHQIKQKNHDYLTFLSPNMLHSLIDDAVKLILIDWTKDFREDIEKFNKKMLYVKKLVDNLGAIKERDNIFD